MVVLREEFKIDLIRVLKEINGIIKHNNEPNYLINAHARKCVQIVDDVFLHC